MSFGSLVKIVNILCIVYSTFLDIRCIAAKGRNQYVIITKPFTDKKISHYDGVSVSINDKIVEVNSLYKSKGSLNVPNPDLYTPFAFNLPSSALELGNPKDKICLDVANVKFIRYMEKCWQNSPNNFWIAKSFSRKLLQESSRNSNQKDYEATEHHTSYDPTFYYFENDFNNNKDENMDNMDDGIGNYLSNKREDEAKKGPPFFHSNSFNDGHDDVKARMVRRPNLQKNLVNNEYVDHRIITPSHNDLQANDYLESNSKKDQSKDRFQFIQADHVFIRTNKNLTDQSIAYKMLAELARKHKLPLTTFTNITITGRDITFKINANFKKLNASTIVDEIKLYKSALENAAGGSIKIIMTGLGSYGEPKLIKSVWPFNTDSDGVEENDRDNTDNIIVFSEVRQKRKDALMNPISKALYDDKFKPQTNGGWNIKGSQFVPLKNKKRQARHYNKDTKDMDILPLSNTYSQTNYNNDIFQSDDDLFDSWDQVNLINNYLNGENQKGTNKESDAKYVYYFPYRSRNIFSSSNDDKDKSTQNMADSNKLIDSIIFNSGNTAKSKGLFYEPLSAAIYEHHQPFFPHKNRKLKDKILPINMGASPHLLNYVEQSNAPDTFRDKRFQRLTGETFHSGTNKHKMFISLGLLATVLAAILAMIGLILIVRKKRGGDSYGVHGKTDHRLNDTERSTPTGRDTTGALTSDEEYIDENENINQDLTSDKRSILPPNRHSNGSTGFKTWWGGTVTNIIPATGTYGENNLEYGTMAKSDAAKQAETMYQTDKKSLGSRYTNPTWASKTPNLSDKNQFDKDAPSQTTTIPEEKGASESGPTKFFTGLSSLFSGNSTPGTTSARRSLQNRDIESETNDIKKENANFNHRKSVKNGRRSTWTEEMLNNKMDSSTGHIVLGYMEKHFIHRQLIDKEWSDNLSIYVPAPFTDVTEEPSNNTNLNFRLVHVQFNWLKEDWKHLFEGMPTFERNENLTLLSDRLNPFGILPYTANSVKLQFSETTTKSRKRLSNISLKDGITAAGSSKATSSLSPNNLTVSSQRDEFGTPISNMPFKYINASFVSESDPRFPNYIAAQCPLDHDTSCNFWQMIWERGIFIIVNLTTQHEYQNILVGSQNHPPQQNPGQEKHENGNKNKEFASTQQNHYLFKYWPDKGVSTFSNYEIYLVSEHVWCTDYIVRSFYVKNLESNETRTLTSFHYTAWSKPAVSHLNNNSQTINGISTKLEPYNKFSGTIPFDTKTFLEFRRKINKSFKGRSTPIVVHCNDGAGRTGMYILIDMILSRLNKGVKEIDIEASVEYLRDQRMKMVESKEQYEFCFLAISEEVQDILRSLIPANS